MNLRIYEYACWKFWFEAWNVHTKLYGCLYYLWMFRSGFLDTLSQQRRGFNNEEYAGSQSQGKRMLKIYLSTREFDLLL